MQETDSSSLEDSFSESLSYEHNLLSPPKLEEYLRAIPPTGFPCLCGRKIPSFLIRSHLPACLHHLSILLNEVPLCTCLQCKGKRTHPGDKLSDTVISNHSKMGPQPLKLLTTWISTVREMIEEHYTASRVVAMDVISFWNTGVVLRSYGLKGA